MAEQAPQNLLSVSFVVVVRNGASHLPPLIADLAAQDFPRELLEILIVDGQSEDDSVEVAQRLLADTGLTYRILPNPGRILSTGWNVALANARNEVILRVDVHATIARDFILRNVQAHLRGEMISGGPIISIAADGSSGLLLAVEKSRFGAGIADFRNPKEKPFYADTIGYGAYRRDVFAAAGGYHEHLVRNQDNEIHYRMSRAGFRFYFDPAITSTHFVRPTWSAFFRQKFLNGYWIALASTIQPACFAPRHFVPFVFTLALTGGLLLGLAQGIWWMLASALVSYLALALLFAGKECRSDKFKHPFWFLSLPPAFLLTHLSYGLGTLVGFFRAPLFRWGLRGYSIPFPLATTSDPPVGDR